MIEYACETEIRIDWSELDSLGHVNNLSIMKYMQSARVHYFAELGFRPPNRDWIVGPIIASVTGRFKKQLFFPGSVIVLTSVYELRNTSMFMKHYVVDDHREVAAEGNDVIVMYDFKHAAKRVIPEDLRERVTLLELNKKEYDVGRK